MLKNLVFDMGGVLIRFNRLSMMEKAGILDPKDQEMVLSILFNGVEWAYMDWGMWSEEDMASYALPLLPEHLHEGVKRILFDRGDLLEPMPGMAELLEEYKGKGYGMYLLSNASAALPKFLPFVPGCTVFDGLLVSGIEKKVKPDAAIYETLLSRFSLKAAECLFIDDMPLNVVGAERVGMKGHVFHHVEGLRAAIKRLEGEEEC